MSTITTSSASFSETLRVITNLKLKELEKQCYAYASYAQVLDTAASRPDPVERAALLLQAVHDWTGSGSVSDSTIGIGNSSINLLDLALWIKQAQTDPSIREHVVMGWLNAVETHIKHVGRRFDSAKLFGNLLNEWLVDDTRAAEGTSGGNADELVSVGRQEMHEQREKFTSLVFEPLHVDVSVLEAYLGDLFSSPEAAVELAKFRAIVEQVAAGILTQRIVGDDVEWTIQRILADANMTDAKRATLCQFLDNKLILEEIANVLTMRLSSLGAWAWPEEGVAMDMRRALNGKYRAFTDPELVDLMFVQYIGYRLQVAFKHAFRSLFRSKAWKPASSRMTKKQNARRREFLGEKANQDQESISRARNELQYNTFIAGQLIESFGQGSGDMAGYIEGGDDTSPGPPETSVPRTLLHLVETECLLNKSLSGGYTVLTTDLEWFGPSLSHDTILTLLRFFGLSGPWLSFFTAFLRMPIRFRDQSEARFRERGTPFSYSLSALCGEVVLSVMDFAVNQRADGLFLYRNHDDIWTFNARGDRCADAWREMQRYAKLTGLKFNMEKTGAASVGGPLHRDLPNGNVRWGMLKFSAEKAHFEIDEEAVTRHIGELKRQLRAARTVFGIVNCWNKYLAFLVRGFGGNPAYCLGHTHARAMIDALTSIQKTLFPGNGGVIGHLRTVICERFGASGLPDGWFYLPMKMGGLGLQNPLPELHIAEDILSKHERRFSFEDAKEADQRRYEAAEESWEERADHRLVADEEGFMPFEEYIEGRETSLEVWHIAYVGQQSTPTFMSLHNESGVGEFMKSSAASVTDMTFFEKWVVAVYGDEIIREFGSLDSVDPTLIPLGMVNVFTQSRVKWDQ